MDWTDPNVLGKAIGTAIRSALVLLVVAYVVPWKTRKWHWLLVGAAFGAWTVLHKD